MTTITQIYTSHQPRPPLDDCNSHPDRSSSDTIFTNKSSSSTAKTSEPAHTRRSSVTSQKARAISATLIHPSPSSKDVVVHSIQAFGPTTPHSITCTPSTGGGGVVRKKSTAILLDSFPFPPCSPVAEGQIDGTEVGHTIRVVCDMDDEDDDVLNEMPNFPMPPERTYTNVSSSSSSSNAPMIEVPQPIEEDRIILANVRVSVPEKRSFFSRSHSHHTPPTKSIAVKMPLSSYNRHFAYDSETRAYIGSQSYRLWSLEEVESRYARYKNDPVQSSSVTTTTTSSNRQQMARGVSTGFLEMHTRRGSHETIRSTQSTNNTATSIRNGSVGAGATMGMICPTTPTCTITNNHSTGLGIHHISEKEKRGGFNYLRRMTSNMSLNTKASVSSIRTTRSHTSSSQRTSAEHCLEESIEEQEDAMKERNERNAPPTPLMQTSTSTTTLASTLTPSASSTATITQTHPQPSSPISTPLITRLSSPTPTIASLSTTSKPHSLYSLPSQQSSTLLTSTTTLPSERPSQKALLRASKQATKEAKKRAKEREKLDKLQGVKLKNGSLLRSGVGDGLYGIVLSDKHPGEGGDSPKGGGGGGVSAGIKASGVVGKYIGGDDGGDDDLPWSRKGEEMGRLEIWVERRVEVQSEWVDGREEVEIPLEE